MPFVSDQIYDLCHSNDTVTQALAESPTSSVESVAEKLYKNVKKEKLKATVGQPALAPSDLERAAECGKFTSRPSDLFLSVSRFSPFIKAMHEHLVRYGQKYCVH